MIVTSRREEELESILIGIFRHLYPKMVGFHWQGISTGFPRFGVVCEFSLNVAGK